MKFSVLINNYNYAGFLADAVEGALDQATPPAEILIVDDGSSDDSPAVARQLAAAHPATVKVIAKENGGQLSAMRAGIDAATGDWCAFLDADDAWQPHHLADAERAITRYPNLDVHYACHRETAGPPLYRSKWPQGVIGPCAALTTATGCRIGTITSTIVMRTELAKKLSSVLADLERDWRTRADDCLLFGAALFGARFHYNATASVDYRIHGNNHFAGATEVNCEMYQTHKRVLLDHLADAAGIRTSGLAARLLAEAKAPDNLRHPKVRRRYRRAIIKQPTIPLAEKIAASIRAYLPRPGKP